MRIIPYVLDQAGSLELGRTWSCATCAAGWVRPTGDLLHQDMRCLGCDGLLVPIEVHGEPKSRVFRRVWRKISPV
jgi:hypothetical protein